MFPALHLRCNKENRVVSQHNLCFFLYYFWLPQSLYNDQCWSPEVVLLVKGLPALSLSLSSEQSSGADRREEQGLWGSTWVQRETCATSSWPGSGRAGEMPWCMAGLKGGGRWGWGEGRAGLAACGALCRAGGLWEPSYRKLLAVVFYPQCKPVNSGH